MAISQEKNKNNFDEQFDFYQLISYIKQHYQTLLGFLFSGMLIGYVLTFAVKAEWQAIAILSNGRAGLPGLVEDPLQTKDRVNSLSFQNKLITKLGLKMDEDNQEVKLIRKTLRASVEKSGYVLVSLRGVSNSKVFHNLNEVVNSVRKIHADYMQPSINQWNQELELLQREADLARQDSANLNKLIENGYSSVSRSNNVSTLISNILLSKEKEGLRLARVFVLKDRISQAITYPTAVVGEVAVFYKPAFPNKKVFSIFGMLIGLITSIVYISLRTDKAA